MLLKLHLIVNLVMQPHVIPAYTDRRRTGFRRAVRVPHGAAADRGGTVSEPEAPALDCYLCAPPAPAWRLPAHSPASSSPAMPLAALPPALLPVLEVAPNISSNFFKIDPNMAPTLLPHGSKIDPGASRRALGVVLAAWIRLESHLESSRRALGGFRGRSEAEKGLLSGS